MMHIVISGVSGCCHQFGSLPCRRVQFMHQQPQPSINALIMCKELFVKKTLLSECQVYYNTII